MFFFNTKPNIRKMTDNHDVKGLIQVLRHGDRSIRLSAAHALGKIGDIRAVEPLLALFNDITYINVYFDSGLSIRATLEEIFKGHDIDPIIYLIDGIEAYNSGKYAIRSLMGFALGGEENPLHTALIYYEWDIMRIVVAEALGLIGDARTVEPLISAFTFLEDHYFELEPAKFHKPDDERLSRPIIEACQALDRSLCKMIIKSLAVLGDDRAVTPLLSLITTPDNQYALEAANALGQLGDSRAVDPLINLLTSSKFHLRETAAKSLGKLSDVRAVEPLITAMKDSELHVCESAAAALAKIGLPAGQKLIATLRDPDMYVRKLAAQTLGLIGDTAAIEPPHVGSVIGVGDDVALSRAAVHALGVGVAEAPHETVGEAAVPGGLQRVVLGAGDVVGAADGVEALVGAERVDVGGRVGQHRGDGGLVDVGFALLVQAAAARRIRR